MSAKPVPVVFSPIFKPKPWGGRKLASLLGKSLPADIAIGESWELVSLPGDESHVRDGPMKGASLSDLVREWGHDLLGGVELIGGRFPLLIKFLDARENLSVQVHPKPARPTTPRFGPADPSISSAARTAFPSAPAAQGVGCETFAALPGSLPAVKHEAWYILDADPGAELLIGLKEGVTAVDLARAAESTAGAAQTAPAADTASSAPDSRRCAGGSAVPDLIRRWPAKPGNCYYLPSGTVHALGAGVVVAEIQTPSDVTYRLFDWGRTDRKLHIRQALENTRYDVQPSEILQPRRHVASVHSTATRLTVTERFLIEKIRLREGVTEPITPGDLAVWIILGGEGILHLDGHSGHSVAHHGRTGAFFPEREGLGEGRDADWKAGLASSRNSGGGYDALFLSKGDVLLIPAACTNLQFEARTSVEWLDVRIPVLSTLTGIPRPIPEPPPQRDGLVKLTRSGPRPNPDH